MTADIINEINATTSDPVKVAIFNSFMSFLGTIVTGVVMVLLAKINKKAKDAATAAYEAKETLAESTRTTEDLLRATTRGLQSIKSTGDRTHAIVNSSRVHQLELTALALRRIADLTQDPEDMASATEAERLVNAPQEEWDFRSTSNKKEGEPSPPNMKPSETS